jgi:predicted DCC family thiol-disulfide oxidoreductase YuxK
MGSPLVLYDGTCGLCARSVRWILRHEKDHEIRFAPLQGETTAALREKFTNIPSSVDTVVYVDGEHAYLRSKAFLHLSRHLRAPWRWAYAVRWFPGFLLDVGYRFIAALRYRMFGRVDACELPSPENRARFLP